MSIVFVSVISVLLISLILVESQIIQNRNDFYMEYESKLVANERGKEVIVSTDPISLPIIGEIVGSYEIRGYIKDLAE